MGEFIGAIAEAFVALIALVVRLIPVVIEVVAYLIVGAAVVIRYGVSETYRARKEKEWAEKRWLKFLQLGAGSFCLAALVAGGVYGVWVTKVRKPAGDVVVEKAGEREDLRVRMESGSNRVTIAVKEGGLSNLFATRTMSELTDALRQNVAVEKSGNQTNTAPRPP